MALFNILCDSMETEKASHCQCVWVCACVKTVHERRIDRGSTHVYPRNRVCPEPGPTTHVCSESLHTCPKAALRLGYILLWTTKFSFVVLLWNCSHSVTRAAVLLVIWQSITFQVLSSIEMKRQYKKDNSKTYRKLTFPFFTPLLSC